MTTVIDLNAECAKLTKLKNRTPSSSEADRKGAFARVAPYRPVLDQLTDRLPVGCLVAHH